MVVSLAEPFGYRFEYSMVIRTGNLIILFHKIDGINIVFHLIFSGLFQVLIVGYDAVFSVRTRNFFRSQFRVE